MIAKRTYLDRVLCRGFIITTGVCGVVISSYEIHKKRERGEFYLSRCDEIDKGARLSFYTTRISQKVERFFLFLLTGG